MLCIYKPTIQVVILIMKMKEIKTQYISNAVCGLSDNTRVP